MNLARETCVTDPVLFWVLVVSNLIIAVSYFVISGSLLWIMVRVRRAPFAVLAALFVIFITACGMTYLCSALVFFRPAWNLEAFICCGTAVVSVATARLLVRSRRYLLSTIDEATELADKVDASPPPKP